MSPRPVGVFGDSKKRDYQNRKNSRACHVCCEKKINFKDVKTIIFEPPYTSLGFIIPITTLVKSSIMQQGYGKEKQIARTFASFHIFPSILPDIQFQLLYPWKAQFCWKMATTEPMEKAGRYEGRFLDNILLKWCTWLYCCRHVWFFCSHLGGVVWQFLSNLFIYRVYLLFFLVPFTD